MILPEATMISSFDIKEHGNNVRIIVDCEGVEAMAVIDSMQAVDLIALIMKAANLRKVSRKNGDVTADFITPEKAGEVQP